MSARVLDRARPLVPQWEVGDVWTDPATLIRWAIRTLNRKTGAVELESLNVGAGSSWWRTTLELLPANGTAA